MSHSSLSNDPQELLKKASLEQEVLKNLRKEHAKLIENAKKLSVEYEKDALALKKSELRVNDPLYQKALTSLRSKEATIDKTLSLAEKFSEAFDKKLIQVNDLLDQAETLLKTSDRNNITQKNMTKTEQPVVNPGAVRAMVKQYEMHARTTNVLNTQTKDRKPSPKLK